MNSNARLALLIFVAFCCSSCVLSGARKSEYLTIPELRKNSDLYDGKIVTLRARLSMSPENYNLWATASDLNHGRTDRCVSIENYEWLRDRSQELDGKFVQVTGVYHRDVVGKQFIVRLEACSNAALILSKDNPPTVY